MVEIFIPIAGSDNTQHNKLITPCVGSKCKIDVHVISLGTVFAAKHIHVKHHRQDIQYVLTFFWHTQNCPAHAQTPHYYHTGPRSEYNISHDTGIHNVYFFFLIRFSEIAWFVFLGMCWSIISAHWITRDFSRMGIGTNNSTKFGKVRSSKFTMVWASWRLLFLTTRSFVQQFVQEDDKENIKFPHYWPFVVGIHRWPVNSLTEDQWCKKCIHDPGASVMRTVLTKCFVFASAALSWVYEQI